MPFIFTFEIFSKLVKREKGRSLKRVKRSKGKRAETKEDERRKANKPSKNQNQGKGRIGQPTIKLKDDKNRREWGSERENKWLS